MAQQQRIVLVNGKNFSCSVGSTVEQIETRIRSRFGLQFGGLVDDNGALMDDKALIGTAVGTISFVDGEPAVQQGRLAYSLGACK